MTKVRLALAFFSMVDVRVSCTFKLGVDAVTDGVEEAACLAGPEGVSTAASELNWSVFSSRLVMVVSTQLVCTVQRQYQGVT